MKTTNPAILIQTNSPILPEPKTLMSNDTVTGILMKLHVAELACSAIIEHPQQVRDNETRAVAVRRNVQRASAELRELFGIRESPSKPPVGVKA